MTEDMLARLVRLEQDLAVLQAQMEELQASFRRVTHVEPTKLPEPLFRIADGTDWDPGDGAGLYLRLGAAWTKL